MNKRLIAFLLTATIAFTGCSTQVSETTATDESQNGEKVQTEASSTITDTEDKDKEDDTGIIIDNDGGAFSHKDLIYFIMVDRFNDGDDENNKFSDSSIQVKSPRSYQGGDLQGVIEKLDYIKSLGATAIWLTPIVKNEPYGYHGYWTEDFYEVDPHFGDMDTLKLLVEEAHKKDMKIMLDYVVNHTGYQSSWLKDPDKSDWFHKEMNITDWANQDQVENGRLAGLPDLNTENPEVRQYFIENALWWINETGVDGMRLDTVRHVPKDYWIEFTQAIKAEYPDFYFLGEVWDSNPNYLESYHQTGIDGLTNYSLWDGIQKAFKRFGKASSLASVIKMERKFSDPELNGIFLDNHDNPRMMNMSFENQEDYLKLGLSFMMTYPSIPVVYYGTEIAMEGGADPDNRKFMEWDKTENSEVLKFYRQLADFRNNSVALETTEFKLLKYNSNFISYERINGDKSAIVILNVSSNDHDISIDEITNDGNYKDLFTEGSYTVKDGKLDLTIDPFGIVILSN